MTEPVREVALFDLPKETSTSLRCSACADRACEAVQQVPGVVRVECDATQSQVRVEFDAARVSADEISRRVTQFDLEFDTAIGHKAWRISGLD